MKTKQNRTFLFKCSSCEKILSIEFEEKEDLTKAVNEEIILECGCGGDCKVLLD